MSGGHALLLLVIFASGLCIGNAVGSMDCYNETTVVPVNRTVEVRCAWLCWSNCWCNVTRVELEHHVMLVCEELILVDKSVTSQQGKLETKKLSDPEFAAIAVIVSLVLSILIAVVVFVVQRNRRKRAQDGLIASNGGEAIARDSGCAKKGSSDDKLASLDARYVHVRPSNVVHLVDTAPTEGKVTVNEVSNENHGNFNSRHLAPNNGQGDQDADCSALERVAFLQQQEDPVDNSIHYKSGKVHADKGEIDEACGLSWDSSGDVELGKSDIRTTRI